MLTGILDLSTLELKGHVFGSFSVENSTLEKIFIGKPSNSALLTQNEEESSFSFNLERGERVLLSSPGLKKNWASEPRESLVLDVVMNRELKPLDVLDEIFFQMKKNSESGLLVNDSSAIILEVSKNVMVKV